MASESLPKGRYVLLLLCALWISAGAAGLWALNSYAFTPGLAASSPPTWPAQSGLRLNSGLPSLVVFVHPQCPCSRATMAELARLLLRCRGRLDAVLCFYKPSGSAAAWEQGDLWHAAEGIPGLKRLLDVDGVEAARFSARTSGQATLYGTEGRLLFSGGITGSRGHAGDNPGCDAIVALVEGRVPATTATPVFGCSLGDD